MWTQEESMAVTRWDPVTTLTRFDREFDELVQRGWGAGSPSSRAGFVPAIEMVTDERDVVIRLELPGIDVEKDVDVVVDKNRLIIRGQRRDERDQQTKGVLVRELRYGSFHREFALPQGFDAANVDATYDRGMLEVRLSDVVEPEPEPRQVQIRGRDGQKTIETQSSD
jgi:HSP20 family protein